MPFLMEQFTGQQQRQTDLAASQLALQQAQKQVAIQEQESNMLREMAGREDLTPTQAGISPEGQVVSPLLQQLKNTANIQAKLGNVEGYRKTLKDIVDVQNKESEVLKRNADIQKEQAGFKASAAQYALDNKDIEGGLSMMMKYDPAGALRLYSNLPKDSNGKILYTPQVEQALKRTVAENMTLKDRADIQQKQLNEQDKQQFREEIIATRREAAADRRAEQAARREERVAKAAEKQEKVTAEQARMQRGINALGGVSSALEAMVKFSEGTTTGVLTNLQTHDGMLNAVRNYTGRAMSDVETRQMNTLFQGIGRNLAAIETSGLATGLAELSKKLESAVYFLPGDTAYDVAFKMADIRRVAEENIQPAIDAGMMTKQQEQAAKKLITRVENAVPYTVIDVIDATRKQKTSKKGTIGEDISKKQIAPNTAEDYFKRKGL